MKFNKFNANQIREINKGLSSGLDVSIYRDECFDSEQMREIRLGLKANLDVSIYAKPSFDSKDMQTIREALENGNDISKYLEEGFSSQELYWISKGLKEGFDVSIYANKKFDGYKMAEIFGALKSGLDLSPFDIDALSEYQLQQVILGLRAGIDVSSYANPSNEHMFEDRVKLVRECVGNALASGENVTQQQLNIIAHYKNDGLDTTAWENYKFDRDRLEQIVKGLEKHVDVDVFAKPKFSKEQMYEIRQCQAIHLNAL